jgi:hypothetical protein
MCIGRAGEPENWRENDTITQSEHPHSFCLWVTNTYIVRPGRFEEGYRDLWKILDSYKRFKKGKGRKKQQCDKTENNRCHFNVKKKRSKSGTVDLYVS